jgi:uncharacterized membrane protein
LIKEKLAPFDCTNFTLNPIGITSSNFAKPFKPAALSTVNFTRTSVEFTFIISLLHLIGPLDSLIVVALFVEGIVFSVFMFWIMYHLLMIMKETFQQEEY